MRLIQIVHCGDLDDVTDATVFLCWRSLLHHLAIVVLLVGRLTLEPDGRSVELGHTGLYGGRLHLIPNEMVLVGGLTFKGDTHMLVVHLDSFGLDFGGSHVVTLIAANPLELDG